MADIENLITEVNRLIDNSFLHCKYGIYDFDSASKTIIHIHNGVKCFYSLTEGAKQIAKVQNELETEDKIFSLAELLSFDISESELGHETTEA